MTKARISYVWLSQMMSIAQVHNSYSTTRVYFNLVIKEVKEYVKSHYDGISPIVSQLSQQIPTQYSQQPSASMFSKEIRIVVYDITSQPVGEYFVINCEIQKLETLHGWLYEGCAKCSSKLTDENGVYICLQYKKNPMCIEPNGSASVLFWDKLVVQLVKKTAPQLKFILIECKIEYDIPAELEFIVGKRLLIKLKRNEYNIKYPQSSISVTHFIMCEDLLDQFDHVATDDDNGGGGGGAVKSKMVGKNKEKSCNEKILISDVTSPTEADSQDITILDDDDDEDDKEIPIAMLSRSKSTRTSKGKKKITIKNKSSSKKTGKRIHAPTKPLNEKKLLKSIKQEKQ